MPFLYCNTSIPFSSHFCRMDYWEFLFSEKIEKSHREKEREAKHTVGSGEWKDFQGPISASQFIHSFIISNSERLLVLTKGLTVGDVSFKKTKKNRQNPLSRGSGDNPYRIIWWQFVYLLLQKFCVLWDI